MSIECPKCNTHMGMREIGGKRPGWECLGCGMFFAKQTWQLKDGTLVRKYPTKPSYHGYVDKDALKAPRRKPKRRLEWHAEDDAYSNELDEAIDEGWMNLT